MPYNSPWGQTYYQPWEQPQQPAAPAPAAEEWEGQNSGYPKPPDFSSILGEDGQLQEQYRLNPQAAVASFMPQFQQYFDQSRGALDKLGDYANGPTGSSPWAMAQLTDLDQQAADAYGNVGNKVNAATNQAYGQAASRGGLTSAMRANLARNAQNMGIQGRQGVQGDKLRGRNAIMTGDADRQLQTLGQLPGMENQRLGIWSQAAGVNQANDQSQQRYRTLVDQENIKNAMGGVNSRNQYNMDMYEQGIKRQAGTEQANATANSGKK